MNLSNTVVVVGESGDTDYEGLFGGTHKTVVLKGVCGAARQLHTNRSYPLEHVIPTDSPNVVDSEKCSYDSLIESLKKLSVFKG